jgi:hypothetical protein
MTQIMEAQTKLTGEQVAERACVCTMEALILSCCIFNLLPTIPTKVRIKVMNVRSMSRPLLISSLFVFILSVPGFAKPQRGQSPFFISIRIPAAHT